MPINKVKFDVYRGSFMGRTNKQSVFSMEPPIAQSGVEIEKSDPKGYGKNLNTLGANDEHQFVFTNAYTDIAKNSQMSNTTVHIPNPAKSIRNQRSESLLRPKFNIR